MMTIEDKNHYQNLKAEMAVSAGDGDPWGWCMAWWFAIAGTLYDRGEDIPREWQYGPGARQGPEPDSFEETAIRDLEISSPALIRMGNVLTRYASWCKFKELDY